MGHKSLNPLIFIEDKLRKVMPYAWHMCDPNHSCSYEFIIKFTHMSSLKKPFNSCRDDGAPKNYASKSLYNCKWTKGDGTLGHQLLFLLFFLELLIEEMKDDPPVDFHYNINKEIKSFPLESICTYKFNFHIP